MKQKRQIDYCDEYLRETKLVVKQQQQTLTKYCCVLEEPIASEEDKLEDEVVDSAFVIKVAVVVVVVVEKHDVADFSKKIQSSQVLSTSPLLQLQCLLQSRFPSLISIFPNSGA